MAHTTQVEKDLEKGLVDDEEDQFKSLPKRNSLLHLSVRRFTALSNSSSGSMLPGSAIDLIRRLTASSRQGSVLLPIDLTDSLARRKFLALLVGPQASNSKSLPDASKWFVNHIELKIRLIWTSIQPSIVGLGEDFSPIKPDDFAFIYQVLTIVLRQLSGINDLAFSTVVDDLLNESFLRDGPDERAGVNQLIFTFIGWLTKLYDPVYSTKTLEFQISRNYFGRLGSTPGLKSRICNSYTQKVDDYIDQPLNLMIGRFGKLIPDTTQLQSSVTPSDWIIGPNVFYQALRRVCGIEIQWVDTLGMHLEFDSSKKSLKLFRFPSFCRLMYRQNGRALLSKLFDDNARDLRSGFATDTACSSSDFFREMLLTYRLLFGQDNESWRLFAREVSRHARTKEPCVTRVDDADPMLMKLCGRSCDAEGAAEIYEEIRADAFQTYYMPSSYPFFADRLLILQGYVGGQNPHGLKALWHDHRNKTDWWQFWAVLFIGGGTLILGTLSLVFQIWQVVLSDKQLSTNFSIMMSSSGGPSVTT